MSYYSKVSENNWPEEKLILSGLCHRGANGIESVLFSCKTYPDKRNKLYLSANYHAIKNFFEKNNLPFYSYLAVDGTGIVIRIENKSFVIDCKGDRFFLFPKTEEEREIITRYLECFFNRKDINIVGDNNIIQINFNIHI